MIQIDGKVTGVLKSSVSKPTGRESQMGRGRFLTGGKLFLKIQKNELMVQIKSIL